MDTHANVLGFDAPAFTTDEAESLAHALFGVRGSASLLVSERDQNFRLTDAGGGSWVLKISNEVEDPGVVDMEVAAVRHIAARDAELPLAAARPAESGTTVVSVPGRQGGQHQVRLIPFLPGRHVDAIDLSPAALAEIGRVTARVGRALRGFFHPAAGRTILWDLKHLDLLRPHLAAVTDANRRAQVERALERYDRIVAPALPGLRAQVIHNDLTLDNLLMDGDRVAGILDFGDMAHTALAFDLPAMLQSVLRGRTDLFEAAATAIGGYVAVTPLEDEEAALLADLLAARMVQTVLISVWRTAEYPDNAYITGWLEPAYELLDQLEAAGWDESVRRLAAAARGSGTRTAIPSGELAERRRRVLGSALSPLTYDRPLHLVRGEGPWLFDATGRRYLDAYNNVPVVGHAHPRVVEAIAAQARALNTNTRYLHESVVLLAERITASMPPGLDTVMFVNSGSEANDLAWRLATVFTDGSGGIVSGWSYHGLTAAIADFSTSEWPRGEQPESVETIPAPNLYRGRHAADADPDAAYAAELDGAVARLAERGHRAAALYVDGTFTADGIVPPSDRYLQLLTDRTAANGAVYVADEVQSGHGRTGDLWSFTASGITPDLVTLGKPMGNGHPVAAVVARSEIVDQFGIDHEFFSTFGGNPVACAAALAVLDVIEDEDLAANAIRVGAALREAIAGLATTHQAIGDVRGRGLMVGVDLVTDRGTRAPAGDLAKRVMNEMRERGVLVSTTGREGNVLKVRPPLVITQPEADLIVTTLDASLTATGA
ncbi:MAG TPA: aminotransferase class III-fold pyridoxal phosphate-dependent enzyme [Candidatus Limnocylindria bacterium]